MFGLRGTVADENMRTASCAVSSSPTRINLLKRRYAGNPLVAIVARDDYDLALSDVEWLEKEYRGRDPEVIKREVSKRPVPEVDGALLKHAPLELTDFHSQDAVDGFNENARAYDPTTVRPWFNVSHDMHRYPDCEYSDFWHDDTV